MYAWTSCNWSRVNKQSQMDAGVNKSENIKVESNAHKTHRTNVHWFGVGVAFKLFTLAFIACD